MRVLTLSQDGRVGMYAYAVKAHVQDLIRYYRDVKRNRTLRKILAENVARVMGAKRLSQ